MNIEKNKSENGQAIIYLMLGLVVFLGFVALAIDGGMALADRRHAQNAADAASLAGGAAAALKLENLSNQTCDYAWSCSNDAVINARSLAVNQAIKRAATNTFTIDNDISDHLGVITTCGPNVSDSTDFIDVTVEISATTPSNFMQLIFPDALHNEVEAVTRVDPGGPLAFGNAIVALDTEICSDPGSQGIIIGGSSVVAVEGGNIFSNGCLRQNGNNMTVVITDGVALGHELFNIRDDNWESPPPSLTNDEVIPADVAIDPPDCSTAPAGQNNVTWNSINQPMAPGLWCITGKVVINNNDVITGDGVTLVMLDGKFDITGKANIHLYAPSIPPDNSHPDNTGTAIPGVLIYMAEGNSNVVTLNGTAESVISGAIYAPHSYVTLNGTGGNTYNPSQVIGWDVELTGDTELFLYYDSCSGYLRPQKITLYK